MSWLSTKDAHAATVPHWTGKPRGAVRVLVEHPEPAARRLLTTGLRDLGYEVVDCGGPGAIDAEHAVGCPVLAGDPCPAVDGADVIVSSLHLEGSDDGMIVRGIADDPASPPMLVEATDWQVGQAFGRADAVSHLYPFVTVEGVAMAIEGLRTRA